MKLSRRIILRGLGGAAIAAPFLRSVAERQAKAQGLPAPDAPKRLIMMFTHYGCLTDQWFPKKSHGALTDDDFRGTSIESLGPYASRVLLPRGIRSMNEWTSDMTLGQGNEGLATSCASYFTCMPVTPNSNDPFSFESSAKFTPKAMGPSLDHVCAKQVSPDEVPLYLRVGGVSENSQTAVSYSGPEEIYPGATLELAFSQLTGLLTPESAPDTYLVSRGKSLVDLVQDDLETLQRFDMSAADQRTLEQWKELVHQTGANPGLAWACSPEAAEGLSLTESNVEAAASTGVLGGDQITKEVTGSLDAADMHSNLAVLTALCDVNRVILLKYPGNYIFSGLGMEMNNYFLANRVGDAATGGTCVADVNEQILTIDRYYAEKFAHLVGTLASVEEGDGDLLDNTAAVWFQQMSDGCSHNLNNLPIIQAGGCGGYFKTGQAINVFDGSADLSRGNSSAACGASSDGEISFSATRDFGTPPEIGNAPINKYFCNLMNAIGVKAGADGFPEVGGTEEVTHFGMYDKTEDFVGGDTNPPTIHDPGGFEELKA